MGTDARLVGESGYQPQANIALSQRRQPDIANAACSHQIGNEVAVGHRDIDEAIGCRGREDLQIATASLREDDGTGGAEGGGVQRGGHCGAVGAVVVCAIGSDARACSDGAERVGEIADGATSG